MNPESEVRGRSRYREPEPTLDFGLHDDVPFDRDPLDPHPEHPTPLELVVRLTRSERVSRVQRLVAMAWNRFDEAMDSIAGQRVAGVCALVSGGNDSYTMAHVFRSVSTHWVHANTGTGIEATREHVRATATQWGMRLIEEYPNPGEGYWDLVRGKVMARSRETGELVQAWAGGFPGSAAHATIYQRIKERGLARVPHHFGISGSRKDQVVFIAGRRRPESKRRATVPHYERKHTILWTSPLAIWHKADLRAYRLLHPDMPLNPVAQKLGMSGECGCLAMATHEAERDQWFSTYPTEPFVLAVQAMEEELKSRPDIPEHRKRWGWGADPIAQAAEAEYMAQRRRAGKATEPVVFTSDALCGPNCGPDPLFDPMDPLFDLDEADDSPGGQP
jgi:3'-phosphoadenosine 5'-phosphosulfate sulfotransferase (PAPS reductase)/FAD synthetase